jgi:protein SCO1/2
VTRRAFLLALAVLAASPAAGAPRSSIPATAFTDFAFIQHPGAALPLDVRLRGPDGSPLRLGDLFTGPPVLLDFEYARCTTLCGVMLDQVTATLAALPLEPERDYRLVAIDIDPATTPQQAMAFAQAHGADRPGMTVLTGAGAEIRRVADAAGFPYRLDAATGQYAHPAGFVIATPDGTISRYLLGLDWRPLDLRLGLVEAAGDRITAPSEQALLFCYCYDPQTGRYNLAIGRLLEIVGVTTLFTVGGMIALATRRGA